MRHVYLVIDSSRAMEDKDLRPNRFIATLKVDILYGTNHARVFSGDCVENMLKCCFCLVFCALAVHWFPIERSDTVLH